MYCGAGLSAAMLRELALPPGTASAGRPMGTATLGFVWRGIRNYRLAPLLLAALVLENIPEGDYYKIEGSCPKGGRGLDCQEEYRHHIGSPEVYELIISKFISSFNSGWQSHNHATRNEISP